MSYKREQVLKRYGSVSFHYNSREQVMAKVYLSVIFPIRGAGAESSRYISILVNSDLYGMFKFFCILERLCESHGSGDFNKTKITEDLLLINRSHTAVLF